MSKNEIQPGKAATNKRVIDYSISASNQPYNDKGYYYDFKTVKVKSLKGLGKLMLTHSLCTQLFTPEPTPNKSGMYPKPYRKTTEAVTGTGSVLFFDIDNASSKDSKIRVDDPITLKDIKKAFNRLGWGSVITPSKNSNDKWEKFHISAFTLEPVANYKTNKDLYRMEYAMVAHELNLEVDSAMKSAIQNLTPAIGREVLAIVKGSPIDLKSITNNASHGFAKRKGHGHDKSGLETIVIDESHFDHSLHNGDRCDCPLGERHSDGKGEGYGFINDVGGITCNGCEVNYHWMSDDKRDFESTGFKKRGGISVQDHNYVPPKFLNEVIELSNILEEIENLESFSSSEITPILSKMVTLDPVDIDIALGCIVDHARVKRVSLTKTALKKNLATQKKSAETVSIHNLNKVFKDRYFPVMVGGSMQVMYWADTAYVIDEKEHFIKELRVSKPSELYEFFRGDMVTKFASWWNHEDRPTYKGVIFNPATQVDLSDYVNLWNGYSCEPKEGDITPFMDLLENVICDGDPKQINYLKKYIAHQFQQPTTKPGVAIVMKGDKGIGKDTFIDALGKLYNDAYLSISNREQLIGRFNSHLSNIVMLSSAEHSFAGSHQEDSVLKNLITNPTLAIEKKGVDAFKLSSYLRVWMSSNEDWVVPATGKERRYFVPTLSKCRQGNNHYFTEFHRWYDNGGKEALLHWVLNLPIEGFDVRSYPHTKAEGEQKLLTLKPWENALIDFVAKQKKDFRFGASEILYEMNEPEYKEFKTTIQTMGIRLKKVFGKSTKITPKGEKQFRGWELSTKKAKSIVEDYIGKENLFDEWN